DRNSRTNAPLMGGGLNVPLPIGFYRDWDRGRERRSRGEYRDYDRTRRERFSPPRHELSPPQKRMRRDWDEHSMHVMQPHILPIQARLGSIAEVELGLTPPVLKSFKEFLLAMDDAVDETEAVKRYNDYKVEFRRQQLQEFFLAHKEEEWFRSKYHPDEVGRRRQEAQAALRNRLNVFLYLADNGWFENLLLDIDRAPEIVKMLDAAVIKMEGGTEHDLRILEQEEEEERGDKAEGQRKEEPRPTEPKGAEEDKKVGGCPIEGYWGPIEGYWGPYGPIEGGSRPPQSPRTQWGGRGGAVPSSSSMGGSMGGGDPKPRPLHKTCSLFMRNIAPNISQAEIVALCKRYPGFMRVALSEPQPERRFFRRGWVTFDRSVNIKEICWSLQNIRLRDCELSPGVNRDLTRRVRNVSGITQHRPIVRHDIQLAARLVHALDARAQLWAPIPVMGSPQAVPSQNPVLRHITDYLIEEVNAEEEELLGGGAGAEEPPREPNPTEVTVERDEKLLKVLDRLLLYLRIVHSVDYYNTSEYVNEDEMPNRCGILHVRGPLPPNRVSHGEVLEWQKSFSSRLAPLLQGREALGEEESLRLGRKDPEQELEKFVSANTQELGKDKWLCPLSGKKFKVWDMGWMGWGKDKWLCPLSGKKFKVWDGYGMYGMYMGCIWGVWDVYGVYGMGWGVWDGWDGMDGMGQGQVAVSSQRQEVQGMGCIWDV
uniref:Uncharacterized protein n=1 Tax=Melopsittacus undulatus TaxID=13146 RepID=A0A8V5GXL3_MELUD